MSTRDLMDAQNNSVDTFALDMAMVIKKHLKLGTLKVGTPSRRFYEDQPTRDPLTKEKSEDHFTILYPPDGGNKTAEANTAVNVDFWEGKVTHGDSSQSSNLSKSLQQTGKSAVFVLLIKVSKACKLRMDEIGEKTISGQYKSRGIPIKRLTITSVDGSAFEYSITASTNSKADFDDESEESPGELGLIHRTKISANTNIFDTDITPKDTPTTLRTQCAFNHSGQLNAIIKNDGVSQTVALRMLGTYTQLGTVLNEFKIIAGRGDTFNFQYEVAGTCMMFRVHENSET